MRWRALLVLLALVISLVPGAALAQDRAESESSFMLSINGNTVIGADQTVDTLVIIQEDAVIHGMVNDALVVIGGTATVTGTIAGDATIINGTITLEDGARVANDVALFSSNINQTDAAVVGGDIHQNSVMFYSWQLTALSILFWIGGTIALLLAGLLFAAIAGRQLTGAGALIVDQPGKTVLTGLAIGIGVPIAAVMALFTLVGIPLGISVLLFALPALAFAGYLVAGTKIGSLLLDTIRGERQEVEHPYLAAVLGLLILQGVGFVPVVGFLLVGLASIVGVGAVTLYAYRAWRGTDAMDDPSVTTIPQPVPAG